MTECDLLARGDAGPSRVRLVGDKQELCPCAGRPGQSAGAGEDAGESFPQSPRHTGQSGSAQLDSLMDVTAPSTTMARGLPAGSRGQDQGAPHYKGPALSACAPTAFRRAVEQLLAHGGDTAIPSGGDRAPARGDRWRVAAVGSAGLPGRELTSALPCLPPGRRFPLAGSRPCGSTPQVRLRRRGGWL